MFSATIQTGIHSLEADFNIVIFINVFSRFFVVTASIKSYSVKFIRFIV